MPGRCQVKQLQSDPAQEKVGTNNNIQNIAKVLSQRVDGRPHGVKKLATTQGLEGYIEIAEAGAGR